MKFSHLSLNRSRRAALYHTNQIILFYKPTACEIHSRELSFVHLSVLAEMIKLFWITE